MNAQAAIILTGNIASGKSTLARGLVAHWPALRYVCVDNVRSELARQGIEPLLAEHRAVGMVMAALAEPGPVLYESSGATRLYRRASAYLRGHRRGQIIRLRTTCGHRTSMHRFEARRTASFRQMPPPFKDALPIQECWYRFEDMLREPVDLLLDTEKNSSQQVLDSAIKYITDRWQS